MKKFTRKVHPFLIGLLSAFLISNQAIAQSVSKTTLIKNVNGYTIDGTELKRFSAIQFTNDTIDQVYTLNQMVNVPKNTNIIDGQGQTMLPGLIDAHGHVLSYGLSLMRADLVNTPSEADAVQTALTYAKENPSITWVRGRGWNQVQWKSNKYPTAKSLDIAFPDTPVWLNRVDGHAGWANSKAMQLAGIDQNTQSPAGGEIIRDESGYPTGIFIDNAMTLIDNIIPEQTMEQQKATLHKSMSSLASLGLTSVHDAGIDWKNIDSFKALANEKKMPIRINAMLYLPSEKWQEILKEGIYNSSDDMFNLNSVKIQADGALGSRGAALINDYSDHSGHKGLLLHEKESLVNYINTSMNAGFQVNTHAIGDNANKLILDIYQVQIKQTKTSDLRHRIEHAQVLRLVDIPRFKENNIIASMQATHATSDKNMALSRLGDERIQGAYAWRKLLNAGVTIAAGSDFPVESPNPFYGLHASVTRQDKQDSPKGGWHPVEKMTRLEALRSFTIDAAYAGHQEKLIGSLSPGMRADFILLADDYFTIAETQLWKNQVQQTWVNGRKVFQKKH